MRENSTFSPPSSLQRLKEINSMVRTGETPTKKRGILLEDGTEAPAKRICQENHTALLRRLQDVANDRGSHWVQGSSTGIPSLLLHRAGLLSAPHGFTRPLRVSSARCPPPTPPPWSWPICWTVLSLLTCRAGAGGEPPTTPGTARIRFKPCDPTSPHG